MAMPTRTFTGVTGQRSIGTAGAEQLSYDLDDAFAMFNPNTTLRDGVTPGGIGLANLQPGVIPGGDITSITDPGGNVLSFTDVGTLSGYCTTNGISVQYVSGMGFGPWIAGTHITINSVQYTIASVQSTTLCTLTTSAGVQTNVAWSTAVIDAIQMLGNSVWYQDGLYTWQGNADFTNTGVPNPFLLQMQSGVGGVTAGIPNGSVSGTCTTNGTAVACVTGSFADFAGYNIFITINGYQYLVASVGSASSLTLATSAGLQSTAVAWAVSGTQRQIAMVNAPYFPETGQTGYTGNGSLVGVWSCVDSAGTAWDGATTTNYREVGGFLAYCHAYSGGAISGAELQVYAYGAAPTIITGEDIIVNNSNSDTTQKSSGLLIASVGSYPLKLGIDINNEGVVSSGFIDGISLENAGLTNYSIRLAAGKGISFGGAALITAGTPTQIVSTTDAGLGYSTAGSCLGFECQGVTTAIMTPIGLDFSANSGDFSIILNPNSVIGFDGATKHIYMGSLNGGLYFVTNDVITLEMGVGSSLANYAPFFGINPAANVSISACLTAAPSAGMFAGSYGTGSLIVDYVNGNLYINAGTLATPAWKLFTHS